MLLSILCPMAAVAAGGAAPLPCQPASLHPNWPTYHIVNNVTTVTLKNGTTVSELSAAPYDKHT